MGRSRRDRGLLRAAAAWAVAGLLLVAGQAEAAIYRCTQEGRVTYRDRACEPSEKQERLDQGPLAGCFEIEDVREWEGGSGTWMVRLAADGENYILREYFSVDDPASRKEDPESASLRRATLEELDAVALQYHLKVTSGFVVDVPGAGPAPMGMFNTWDAAGDLKLVGLFLFVNGLARRATCP